MSNLPNSHLAGVYCWSPASADSGRRALNLLRPSVITMALSRFLHPYYIIHIATIAIYLALRGFFPESPLNSVGDYFGLTKVSSLASLEPYQANCVGVRSMGGVGHSPSSAVSQGGKL